MRDVSRNVRTQHIRRQRQLCDNLSSGIFSSTFLLKNTGSASQVIHAPLLLQQFFNCKLKNSAPFFLLSYQRDSPPSEKLEDADERIEA